MKHENHLHNYACPILFFTVTGKAWGIKLKWVREIVPAVGLAPVPNANDFVAGVVNIRGDVVSVLDAASLLQGNGSNHGGNRIILLDVAGPPVGLAVDGVKTVETTVPEAFTEPPRNNSEAVSKQYISGVTTWNGSRIPLLDIPALVINLQDDIPYIKEARV